MAIDTNATTTIMTVPDVFPKLVFINGGEQRTITLDHTPFTIGRQSDKDLVVADARASRDHATIQLEGNTYFLLDLGSRHGTYVNGERVQRRVLANNDRLEFGARGGPYLIFNPGNADQIEELKELAATSRVSIFSKLSPGDVVELGKIVKLKDYAPDTSVFFQGDPSDSLYMLLKGSVKVTERSSEGHEKILDILGAGEIFGELAMLDGQPRSASVVTCEPTQLGVITHKDFRQFVGTRSEILWKVLAALCERVRKTSSNMLELSSRDVPYRVLAALHQLAEKHGEVAPDGSCLIKLKLGIADVAAMVGSTPEIVRRLLQRYQEEGLIEMGKNKQLIVPDPAALAHALEFSTDWF